jgi:hypothetical protein
MRSDNYRDPREIAREQYETWTWEPARRPHARPARDWRFIAWCLLLLLLVVLAALGGLVYVLLGV